LADRVHPEDWPKFRELLDQIAGGSTESFQGEYRIVRPNGDVRWLWGSAGATLSSERSRRVAGVTIDITERREAEERQLLLAREVDHRARNTLAVVQSILQLTKAPSIGEYKSIVQGRIAALSRAHTLISESRWVGADLRRLVDDELAPFRAAGEDRILTSGPAVSLKPAMAQSVALVLHELATNAAKYGALSAPQGRLAVSWTKSGGVIGFDWVERGGPSCSSPAFRGFGSTIIGTTIERQLHGSFKFDWDPAGLSFQFRLPVDEPDSEEPAPSSFSLPPLEVGTSKLLLVEDEALVALMMREIVAEFGFKIAGPCADLASARRAIESEEVHAAVLDVNLNGTPVYPVAELLESRGIPFVFVTGYAQETIDPKFAHISVYQKPVDRDLLRKGLFAAIGTSAASSRQKKIVTLS
jgi:two-component sensor histidine kinase/CheY-like chemotaxis protein